MSIETHNLNESGRPGTWVDEALRERRSDLEQFEGRELRGEVRPASDGGTGKPIGFGDPELTALEAATHLVDFARASGYEIVARAPAHFADALLEHPNGDRIAAIQFVDGRWVYASVRDVNREAAQQLFTDALMACDMGRRDPLAGLFVGAGSASPYGGEPPRDLGTIIDFVRTRDPTARLGPVSLETVRERLRVFRDEHLPLGGGPEGPLTPPKTPAIQFDGADPRAEREVASHLEVLKRSVDLEMYARAVGYEVQPRDGMPGVQVLKHPGTRDTIAVARVAAGDIYAALPDYRLNPAGDCSEESLRHRRLHLRDCIARSPYTGTIVDFEGRRHRLMGQPEPDLEAVRKHLSGWCAQQALAREKAANLEEPTRAHERARHPLGPQRGQDRGR